MKKSFIVKFFTMLMLLATSTTMSAQIQYLCITEKGGGVTEIPLSEFPVLLVEDGLLKVAATNPVYAEIAVGDLLKYELKFAENSAKPFDGEGEATAIKQVVPTAKFSGFAPGTVIRVYNAGGQEEGQIVVGESGSVKADLNAFGKGIHVVRTPNSSYKIINK
jgi:hypothetical protein